MTKSIPHVVTDADRKHLRQLMLLALAAGVVSLAVGGVGGWLVVQQNEGERIPYAVVLAPLIICTVVTMTPLYFVRKRWFPTPEALQATVRAATGQEPGQPG